MHVKIEYAQLARKICTQKNMRNKRVKYAFIKNACIPMHNKNITKH